MKTAFAALFAAAVLGGSVLGVNALASDDVRSRLDLSNLITIDEALALARDAHPGAQIIEAELEDDDGGVWEIKLVDEQNRMRKMYLDAQTGTVTKADVRN